MGYLCVECAKFHQTPTPNYICNELGCTGKGLTGLLIEEKEFYGRPSKQIAKAKSASNNHRPLSAQNISKEPITITIGRSPSNHISINNNTVSLKHAVISIDHSGKITLQDLNSLNGTFINGKAIKQGNLLKTDKVSVANISVDWVPFLKHAPTKLSNLKTIRIGRSKKNNVVILNDKVSQNHAAIIKTMDGKLFIKDLNSRNGTFVNGQKTSQKQLLPEDVVHLAKTYKIDWKDLI